MFGWKKKRKKNPITPVPQAEAYVPSEAFTRRPLYESHRASRYTLFPRLQPETMLPELDALMAEHLPPEALERYIFAAAREAIPDLQQQRYTHNEAIRRIQIRWRSDRADFARLLAQRQKELEALEAAHKKTCYMLSKNTGEELL